MGNSKGMKNVVNKKYHYTYQIKNLVNEKTYIGRHSTDDVNDGYMGSGKILKRAIKFYGIENFSLEILGFFDSFEELVEEESFIVDDNFVIRNDTYNIVTGGSNPIMYGEENPSWKGGSSIYKRKGRPDFSGEKNPMFGKKHTEAVKNKISKANKGNTPPNKGCRLSEEQKESMISKQKTRKQLTDGVSCFKSIRDCARKLGVTQQYVQYRLRSNSEKFSNWKYI
jgi:group I intron endonuclease